MKEANRTYYSCWMGSIWFCFRFVCFFFLRHLRDGSVGKGTCSLTLIPGTHMVQGENWLLQALLWPPYMLGCMHRQAHTNKLFLKKSHLSGAVVAHTFNRSTWEAEAGEDLWVSEFKANLVYRVPGQADLCRETLSWKKKKKEKVIWVIPIFSF